MLWLLSFFPFFMCFLPRRSLGWFSQKIFSLRMWVCVVERVRGREREREKWWIETDWKERVVYVRVMCTCSMLNVRVYVENESINFPTLMLLPNRHYYCYYYYFCCYTFSVHPHVHLHFCVYICAQNLSMNVWVCIGSENRKIFLLKCVYWILHPLILSEHVENIINFISSLNSHSTLTLDSKFFLLFTHFSFCPQTKIDEVFLLCLFEEKRKISSCYNELKHDRSNSRKTK